MKKKIHNKQDWRDFALGYLGLASLACREMSEKKYGDRDFNIENIYIPTLFNLKHGIEIFLKAVSIEFLDKETMDGSDYSHNIEEIFLKLRKEVKEDRLKSAIAKYEKEHESLSEKVLPIETSVFDQLEALVRKYHSLDFVKDKIGVDYVIKDEDNTAFKYPTNNLQIQIDYSKIAKKFKREDVLQTLIDCAKLESILWQLYILIYTEKN